MNLFVERDGKRIFAVSTRNNYGEAKLEILLEVECICSDDDDLLVVFYKSYQNVKYELQEESQTLFQRAVQDDTNRRIKDLGDAFCFSYSGANRLERDSITIKTADAIIHMRNNKEVARRISSQ